MRDRTGAPGAVSWSDDVKRDMERNLMHSVLQPQYAESYQYSPELNRYVLVQSGKVLAWINGNPVYWPRQETPPRLRDCVVDLVQLLDDVQYSMFAEIMAAKRTEAEEAWVWHQNMIDYLRSPHRPFPGFEDDP